MDDVRNLELRDGRGACIRLGSVSDAQALIALDRALAEDGRGMVLTVDQVRSIDEERRRIDDVYRRMAAGESSILIVADVAGTVMGTAQLIQLTPARCRHVGIFSVGVHPRAQRLGLGRALMRYLIDHAEAHGLERLELYVRADNTRARALYESEGFVREGVRSRFIRLEDGSYVDDLVMVRFVARAPGTGAQR